MSDTPPDPAPQTASAQPAPAQAAPAQAAPAQTRLHTEARERRGRWPGMVWAIPLAALLVVGYLGVQALANRGVEVLVTFKSSGGARAGDTPVVYKGVTVGHVVNIQIARNARDVEMKLRLDSRARPYMREGTKFWLIGAEPSLTDLSSLKAAVSGVSIGVSPGKGALEDHFTGLDQTPVVPPDQAGTLYVVEGGQLNSTRVGSGIYYHGALVGRVTRVELADPQKLRLVIFVNAPFDKLVHAGSLFFNANAADVQLSAGHLSANIGPGSSVITGGIEFDTPLAAAGQPQSPANTVFGFFPNEFQAGDQPRGPQLTYRAVFHGAAQRPQVDAPVWLSGERVGRVLASRMTLPKGATTTMTEVTLEIEPQSLGLPTDGDVRASTDAALKGLIRGGYRMQMGQYPPLVGTATLIFAKSGAGQGGVSGAALPEIPTAGSTGVDELTSKVNVILDKVNAVPIAAIGGDVRQITAHLAQLVSSPELTDSLHKLDGTLTSVDQMTREVQPQVGPLVARLNQTADQLQGVAANANAVLGGGPNASQDANLPAALGQVTEAARAIRSLADYLGRHPEALVKGKTKGE